MKKTILLCLTLLATLIASTADAQKQPDVWPNGEPMDQWFADTAKVNPQLLGRRYVVTRYGVRSKCPDVQTKALQAVIDQAAHEGGGIVVIPKGTFLTGSLFFRPGTHLHLEKGAVLKGSQSIADYPVVETRIEGQTCKYFAALVNADHVDGFTITGPGTIDGSGKSFWQAFWIRRLWNPECTNKDEQRPRLTFISNSSNVTLQDVRLINSPFWTNHIYKCDHVRFLDLYIYSSTTDIKGPSTDAIDIDACHDVVVRGCYMNVNDDAVVLKGGKGTFADQAPENGPCYNILVERCHYGTVHGCITVGSESLHDWNIVMRNCVADDTRNVLWLKMRPDTPQHYEWMRIEGLSGRCRNFLLVRPWTQFYAKGNRDDMPLSRCNDIAFSNISMQCEQFLHVEGSDKYSLRNFSFSDIACTEKHTSTRRPLPITNCRVENVVINGQPYSPHSSAQGDSIIQVARQANAYFMQHNPDPTVESFVHNKRRPSHIWTRGVYYEGLMALYDVCRDSTYLDYTDRWANHHRWAPCGNMRTTHADNQCCMQTYLERYRMTHEQRMLQAVRHNLDHQMQTQRVNYWTWIDAIQMAMPVYAQMYGTTGERRYIDYAMRAYQWCRNECGGGLYNKEEGLWWRDKDFVPPYKEKDGANCYWSRGNGWVYAALVRVMDELSPDDPYFAQLHADYMSMSRALLACQREDGFWNVSLASPTTFGGKELTGTSLFLYGMAWGIRRGYLQDETYLLACDRAWQDMAREAVHANGFLGWVQGTGKQPSDGQPLSYSRVPDFEDYGLGCFLLGAVEYYKVKKLKS